MTIVIERSVVDWPLILAIWGGFTAGAFGSAGFILWRRRHNDGQVER